MGIITYEILCEHCGQEFTAKSMKRQYCSTKCRTAAHRHKNRTPKQEAYSIIARIVHHALSERDWSNEPEAIQKELKAFSDLYW